jgi:ABC-type multidrug transport system permease subunit
MLINQWWFWLIIISLYCFIAGIIFGLCSKYKIEPIAIFLIAIFWPLILVCSPFVSIAVIGQKIIKGNNYRND